MTIPSQLFLINARGQIAATCNIFNEPELIGQHWLRSVGIDKEIAPYPGVFKYNNFKATVREIDHTGFLSVTVVDQERFLIDRILHLLYRSFPYIVGILIMVMYLRIETDKLEKARNSSAGNSLSLNG